MNLGTLAFDAFNQQQAVKFSRQQQQAALAQQQQAQQRQGQIQGILGGLISGPDLTQVGGINPLANSPVLVNPNAIGTNDANAIVEQSVLGNLNTDSIQPLQSPIPDIATQPETLATFDPFKAQQEIQQFEISQAEQIAQLAALGANKDQVSAATDLAGLRSRQLRTEKFGPVTSAISSITQRLFTDDDENSAKRIARNLEKLNPNLKGFLKPDEEGFRDRVLQASNALGIGEDVRGAEINVSQKDRIDDNALANDLTLEQERQKGTNNTAKSNQRVAEINNRVALGAGAVTSVQKEIASTEAQIRRLEDIEEDLSDGSGGLDTSVFLRQSKIAASLGSALDSVGIDFSILGSREALDRQATVKPKIKEFFNAYRKEITGAAAAVQELADLEQATLTFNIAPREFEIRFANIQEAARRELNAKRDSLKNGTSTEQISVRKATFDSNGRLVLGE